MPVLHTRRKSITAGFAHRLRRTIVLLVAMSVILGYLITDRTLKAWSHRALNQQARLCAAAITPGPNGDLSDSVARLQSRFDRLIAVATLDPAGNLGTVYPTRPAHRQAVLASLEQGTDQASVSSPRDGKPLLVSSVVVPLNGTSGPAVQRVLVLLERSDAAIGWLKIAAASVLVVGGLGLIGAWSLRRWFDHQIALPLRYLAEIARRPVGGLEGPNTPEVTRWHETADLAEQFDRFLHTLSETDIRIERMELEMKHQIQQREIGFHRQLRREKDRAKVDPLTGLRNRSYLDEKIEPLFKQHEATGEDLTAVMLDVDNFKQYNDTNGHQAGDTILKFAGALLRGGIRPTDHAIRYGGDEFLLLLPDTSARQAEITVERLLKLFHQYVTRLDRSLRLSLSAGVASLADDGPKDGQALIAQADAALYVAKRKGKNTIERHQTRKLLPDCPVGAHRAFGKNPTP